MYKKYGIYLSLIYCLLITPLLDAQSSYPNPDLDYTHEQIKEYIKEFQKKKDTLGLALAFQTYARNQENWQNTNESPFNNYRISLELFRNIKDSLHYYIVLANLGVYFMDRPVLNEYAKEYLSNTIKYFRGINDKNREVGHLINLANVYIYDNEFDTAGVMLLRASEINKKLKDRIIEGRIFAALSDFYGRKKNPDAAILYAKKSLSISEEFNIPWLKAVSQFYIGVNNELLNKNDEAIYYLTQSISITSTHPNLLGLHRENLFHMANCLIKKKDYKKSTSYLQEVITTTYNIYNSRLENDLRSFQTYQIVENHKEQLAKVKLQKKLADVELKSLQSRQQIYILLLLLFLIIVGFLAFSYFNRQRLTKFEIEKNQKNMQIENLHNLINGQESERYRISQDLHDGLGTLLSRIKIYGESLATPIQLIQMLDEACKEVRNISSNLQPNTLANFGLVMAIQDMVTKQSQISPEIIFQHFGTEFRIPPENSLMIYRIIQELLTNSLKHANATEILIQIIFFDSDAISLTVEDNGIGFEQSNIPQHSNGWNNIHSRVRYLQGNVITHSNKSFGTSVTIRIPTT